jgi:hypothetical protein
MPHSRCITSQTCGNGSTDSATAPGDRNDAFLRFTFPATRSFCSDPESAASLHSETPVTYLDFSCWRSTDRARAGVARLSSRAARREFKCEVQRSQELRKHSSGVRHSAVCAVENWVGERLCRNDLGSAKIGRLV